MKKISAILLICTFALSQYARQLSYLECKFSNLFKTATTQCDCEKKGGFSKAAADDTKTSPAIHTHIHPDEFFSKAEPAQIVHNLEIIIQSSPLRLLPDISEGTCSPPWRPPIS